MSGRAVSVLAALALVATSSVASGETTKSEDPKPTKPETQSPASTENQESSIAGTDLEKMLRRESVNADLRVAADGTVIFDLNGGFRSVMVAHQTPDGKMTISCIESKAAAERIFARKVKDPEPEPPSSGKKGD